MIELTPYQQDMMNKNVDLQHEGAQMAASPAFHLRPRLSIDGNKWSALYGENLQDGVAGFGDSPAEAYADFDRIWFEKLSSRPTESAKCAGCGGTGRVTYPKPPGVEYPCHACQPASDAASPGDGRAR